MTATTPAGTGAWDRDRTRLVDLLIVAAGLAGAGLGGVLAASTPLLAAALVLLLAAVLLAGRDPDLVTVVVVGVLYSNAAVVGVVVHGLPAVAALVVPLLLTAPLLYQLLVRRLPLVGRPFLPWMGTLAIVNVVAAIQSDDPAASVPVALTFLSEGFALFFLLVNAIRSLDVLRRVLAAVVAVAGLLGAVSVVQQVTQTYERDYLGFAQVNETVVPYDPSDWQLWDDLVPPPGQPRLAGPIGEKNFYGLILLVTLPLALYFALTTRGPLRLAAAGAGLLVGAGVLLTMSRGAGVAIALAGVGLAVAGLLPRRLLLFGAGAAVVVLSLVPAYTERLATLSQVTSVTADRAATADAADDSLRGRYSEMVAAGRAFADHPVVGVGPGQFASHYQEYSAGLGIDVHGGRDREAHNLYLDLAAELGLVGLVAFLGLAAVIGRRLLAVRRRHADEPEVAGLATALLTSLALLLASGLFLHMAYERYLFLVLALAATLTLVPLGGGPAPRPVPERAAGAA